MEDAVEGFFTRLFTRGKPQYHAHDGLQRQHSGVEVQVASRTSSSDDLGENGKKAHGGVVAVQVAPGNAATSSRP